jgi:ATP-dependent Clp protease, protease subunit
MATVSTPPHRPTPEPPPRDPDRPGPARPQPLRRPPVPAPQPLPPALRGPVIHNGQIGSDVVLDRLLDERIVHLGRDLDDAGADRVITRLLLLAALEPRQDITLYVGSASGSASGSAGAAMAVYDTMQAVAPDVATCAIGLVGSAGQLLLTAGAAGKRSVLPHSRILLGRTSAALAGAGAGDRIGDQLRDEIIELTARHSGQPLATVAADVAAQRWFSAAQAVGYGLADRVLGG